VCWFYDDRATRLKGCVVSRFQWQGRDHVVLAHGNALVIREACLVTEDESGSLGFGDIDEDLSAEIAEIVRR
jgi:hypothetical protein